MNRIQRRRSERCSPNADAAKQTHKLRPQTCVVWVPSCGYVAYLSPESFRAVSHPAYACHLTENDAEELAAQLRTQLGLRGAIRPYYAASAS